MKTVTLKWVTSLCIVASVSIMVGWPLMIGQKPTRTSPKNVKLVYFQKGLYIASGLTLAVLGSGVGAFLLMRRAREEYREASMENMRGLIEGARDDQLRKQSEGQAVDEE